MSNNALAEVGESLADGFEEVIDPETGEYLVMPIGPDRLAVVVGKAAAASEQEKAWGRYASFLKAILVREQPEKVAVFGDFRSTLVFSSYEDQDIPGCRAHLEEAELTAAEWRALALAAKGYDRSRLDAGVGQLIEPFCHSRDRKPYALISAVRRLAKGDR